MLRNELIRRVEECGDAIITYRSTNSRKWKYNVCTLDFSTPYIQNKKNKAVQTPDTILFFCWDTDSFRLLNFNNVKNVVPLSSILKNNR